MNIGSACITLAGLKTEQNTIKTCPEDTNSPIQKK